jgi:hypothetical protein
MSPRALPRPSDSPRLTVEPLDDRVLPAPVLSIADAGLAEHDSRGVMTFVVTLSEPSAGMVAVDFATADINARAKTDYTPTSGTLTFAPGEVTKTITVAVKNDGKAEPDEMFAVDLSGAVGAALADPQAIGVIYNDDYPGKKCRDPRVC